MYLIAMWGLGPNANKPEWQIVETPFSNDLFEVVTTSNGPYAVGDGGIIAGDRGNGWEIITDDGPNVSQNQMRTLDVTDDGKRLWFAGSSGALGCYDVETNRKFDYSYPKEKTSTWESIAVAGQASSEKVLVANGSGEVLPFTLDGFTVNWGVTSKPGGKGATMTGLAASPDGYGYGIDTSGNAFMTTKQDRWKDIGVIDSQVKFYDIWAEQNGRVYVAAGQGRLYRYDNSYQDWTPIGVAEKGDLKAFDMYKNQMVALGDGGLMYQRTDSGNRWESVHTPTKSTLYDLALGHPDVAVGKNGLVLRRPRGKTRQAGASSDADQYTGRGEAYDSDQNKPGESNTAQAKNQKQTKSRNQKQQSQSQNQKQKRPQAQRQPQSQKQQNQAQPQTQNQSQTRDRPASRSQTQTQDQTRNQKQTQPRTQTSDQTQPQNQNLTNTQPQTQGQNQGQDRPVSQSQPQNQTQSQNQDSDLLKDLQNKVEQLTNELRDGGSDKEQSS